MMAQLLIGGFLGIVSCVELHWWEAQYREKREPFDGSGSGGQVSGLSSTDRQTRYLSVVIRWPDKTQEEQQYNFGDRTFRL